MAEARVEQKKSNTTIMVIALVLTAVTFLAGRLVTPLAVNLGIDDLLVRPIVRAVVGLGCMIALGGASWLSFNGKAILDAWHFSRPLIMINLIVAAFMLAVYSPTLFGNGDFLPAGAITRLLYVTILCFFVGVNEEAMFRGLMFGGLLAGMGNRKNGVLWAAIISSLAFGFIHVAFDLNFDNPLGIVQGLLKTIETGMFGFILCVPVLESRCMLGAMTVHMFFDWILMALSAIDGSEITAQYISADPQVALSGIIVFIVFIVLYTPKTIQAFKRLRSMRLPQYGPFVNEKSAKLSNTARRDEELYNKRSHENEVDAKIGRLRDHKVFNNPHLTILSTFVVYVLLINILDIIPSVVFRGQPVAYHLGGTVISVGVSALLLYGFQRHFRGELSGLYGSTTAGLLLALPGLALAAADVLDWGTAKFNNPIIALLIALAPGVSEEVVNRIIPGTNWMRIDRGSKSIWTCILATSAFFGASHALNIFAGASVSMTLFQVFYAICIGVAFQAVFLRTGSIWPTIIVHTLIDALDFLTRDIAKVGLMVEELEFGPQFWITLVVAIALLVWGIYLARPAKHAEIAALWKEKWSQ